VAAREQHRWRGDFSSSEELKGGSRCWAQAVQPNKGPPACQRCPGKGITNETILAATGPGCRPMAAARMDQLCTSRLLITGGHESSWSPSCGLGAVPCLRPLSPWLASSTLGGAPACRFLRRAACLCAHKHFACQPNDLTCFHVCICSIMICSV
jgi:hypothetical protein